jgi:tRNA (cmo5U34)-methyltransferase
MVLHHVEDISQLLDTVKDLLQPGGYLAIGDLDKEDGTFHEDGTENVHPGFDRQSLKKDLEKTGFSEVEFETVFVMHKKNKLDEFRDYPIFLMTAKLEKTGK